MALIVAAEDDADVADLLAAALGRDGHTVHVVPTGRRVLELIAERRPDLVVLGPDTSGPTGLEVARRLRADRATAGLPMLMISAGARHAADDVADRVLHPPVSPAAVAAAARDLLTATAPRSPRTPPLTDPARLAAVAALLDDPDPIDEVDLTLAAANVAATAGARTAVVSLALNEATLAVAGIGLPDLIAEAEGMPLEWTPCGTVAGGDRAVAIEDLAVDPVHRDSPLTVRCGVRAYAGVPLRTAAGFVVGTLAVMDPAPIGFSARVVRRLTAAAPDVLRLVERRRR